MRQYTKKEFVPYRNLVDSFIDDALKIQENLLRGYYTSQSEIIRDLARLYNCTKYVKDGARLDQLYLQIRSIKDHIKAQVADLSSKITV